LRALKRLMDATAVGDADGVYISVTEATNWLVSIADGSTLKGDQDVEALRHARNRSHHNWASIVFQNDTGTWLWRPASQLPAPTDQKKRGVRLEPIYVRVLEGQPMLDVFGRLASKVASAKSA